MSNWGCAVWHLATDVLLRTEIDVDGAVTAARATQAGAALGDKLKRP